MKTKIISELKKELLVLELPEGARVEITPRLLAINKSDGSIQLFKGNYTLLGKVNEIKEEDVEDLVEGVGIGWFEDYQDKKNGMFKTALESFNSCLEKHLFWVNPHGKQPRYSFDENVNPRDIKARCYQNMWKEAQEKTFDRNRVKIFVKN